MYNAVAICRQVSCARFGCGAILSSDVPGIRIDGGQSSTPIHICRARGNDRQVALTGQTTGMCFSDWQPMQKGPLQNSKRGMAKWGQHPACDTGCDLRFAAINPLRARLPPCREPPAAVLASNQWDSDSARGPLLAGRVNADSAGGPVHCARAGRDNHVRELFVTVRPRRTAITGTARFAGQTSSGRFGARAPPRSVQGARRFQG